MDRPIRVALVDAYPMFREGVVRTIGRCPDLALVAEGGSVEAAFGALRDASPDIWIIDISAAQNGIPELGKISNRYPNCKIIILTAMDDLLSVSNALAIGVRGYILKGVTGLELIGAIKTVHGGQPFVTSALASRLLVEANGGPLQAFRHAKLHSSLSNREQQILEHISKGLTNREIAEHLGVKVKTIKYYLTNLFKKLEVTNRLQAVQVSLKSNYE